MTISIVHFSDNASDYNSVYIDAHTRHGLSLYNLKTVDEEIVDESSNAVVLREAFDKLVLKMEGRVAVFPSNHLYKAFSGNHSFGTNDLISNNFEKTPLPICVRYKSDKCIVIERPPFKMFPNIRYGKRSWRREAKYQQEREIWIPWTVMILVTNTSFSNPSGRTVVSPYLFFRDGPLTSFDDSMVLPYTPNVFKDGRICMGDSETRLNDEINNKKFTHSDIAELYSFIANEYFMGGWNLDLGVSTLDLEHDQFSDKSNLLKIIDVKSYSNIFRIINNWICV